MSKLAFALIMVLLLLSACNGRDESAIHQTSPRKIKPPIPTEVTDQAVANTVTYSSDSLQYLARENFELLTYRTTPDTLQLVSTSSFLFYPFGHLATVTAFQRRQPKLTLTQESDGIDTSVRLYRGTFKNSFVKLFLNKEKNAIEMVSGHLYGPEIKLVNGIEVGMSKRNFFAIFFKKPAAIEKGNVNVIELISGLDGIQHYYIFRNNVLERIEFDTDYQFSKL